jgi:hypothetical protein
MSSIWGSVIPIYKAGSLQGKSKHEIQKMFDESNSKKVKPIKKVLTHKERFIAERKKRKQ